MKGPHFAIVPIKVDATVSPRVRLPSFEVFFVEEAAWSAVDLAVGHQPNAAPVG